MKLNSRLGKESNPLGKVSKHNLKSNRAYATAALFADDTNLLCAAFNSKEIENILNKELNNVNHLPLFFGKVISLLFYFYLNIIFKEYSRS